jgi:DNA-binding SARP family transcriptional activator/tetratricopeptide (TPR) repeat protein
VLSLTALRLGRPVSREEVVDRLWGERPPPSWVSQIHGAVARVRALLDPGRERRARTSLLSLDRSGYVLHLEPDAVDVHRFSALLVRARTEIDTAGKDVDRRGPVLRGALVTLDTALREWRGPVLAGESAGLREHAVSLSAAGQRLDAAATLADLALTLGRPDLAIEHLGPLTRAEPYHEGLHARFVLALAARGERAVALDVFTAIRGRLVDDLGMEPGPELQRAQLSVLRGEHPWASEGSADEGWGGGPEHDRDRWTVPRLLPPDLPDFTGREGELDQLASLLTDTGPPRPVAAVAGMAGVGKTALVVRAAHRLAAAHPDGQLYVNLRGADATPVRPADVLARFLRAIGVDGPAIPQNLASREDLYRTRTAGRRLLVVLDNAASAAQVRALLPGGPDCSVLVSARARMPALEGARWIDLDVLPPERSITLLGRVAGVDRIAADPAAAARIAGLCGHLPLAVRIAGARLAARPGWPPSHLAGLLRHERRRLDQLAVADLDVRASMELSYRELRAQARRAFRLLGLLDAPDFPARVAAAVLRVPVETAAAPLAELANANLIIETGPDAAGQLRYRFHDLVRLYARERAEDEDGADLAADAIRRALGAWLGLAERFARAVPGPCYAPLAGSSERPELGDLAEHDAVDPLEWFDSEQLALRAGVRQACREGLDELAFELAGALEKYYDLRGMYEEWRATNEQVRQLCQERGNLLGEAVMLRGLIDVRTWNTVYREGTAMGRSLADSRRLAAMFEKLDQPRGLSDAEVACAWGYCAAGDQVNALICAERGLALAEASGHVGGRARAHVAIALVRSFTIDLSTLSLADGVVIFEHLEKALSAARKLRNPRYEASVLQFLGIAFREAGDAERSDGCLQESLAISRRYNDRYTEVLTLLSLARLHLVTGDARARAEAEHSLALGRRFTMPHHVAEALAVLGQLALAADDPAKALEQLVESVALWRTRGWPLYLAETLLICGVAHQTLGDPDAAVGCWSEAADLFTSLGVAKQADRARLLLNSARQRTPGEVPPQ